MQLSDFRDVTSFSLVDVYRLSVKCAVAISTVITILSCRQGQHVLPKCHELISFYRSHLRRHVFVFPTLSSFQIPIFYLYKIYIYIYIYIYILWFIYIRYRWESQEERDHQEDRIVRGWTILKWILER
jgi:hypothetical protein